MFPDGRLYNTRGRRVSIGTDYKTLLPGVYRYQTLGEDHRVDGDDCAIAINYRSPKETIIPMPRGEPFEITLRPEDSPLKMAVNWHRSMRRGNRRDRFDDERLGEQGFPPLDRRTNSPDVGKPYRGGGVYAVPEDAE